MSANYIPIQPLTPVPVPQEPAAPRAPERIRTQQAYPHPTTPDLSTPGGRRQRIIDLALKDGLDPSPVVALAEAENHFTDKVSPKGARGPMQIMPATAVQIAQQMGETPDRVLNDPDTNLRAGVFHWKQLVDKYQAHADPIGAALVGYNAGEGQVHRYDHTTESHPFRETTRYVQGVKKRMIALDPEMAGHIQHFKELSRHSDAPVVPVAPQQAQATRTPARIQGGQIPTTAGPTPPPPGAPQLPPNGAVPTAQPIAEPPPPVIAPPRVPVRIGGQSSQPATGQAIQANQARRPAKRIRSRQPAQTPETTMSRGEMIFAQEFEQEKQRGDIEAASKRAESMKAWGWSVRYNTDPATGINWPSIEPPAGRVAGQQPEVRGTTDNPVTRQMEQWSAQNEEKAHPEAARAARARANELIKSRLGPFGNVPGLPALTDFAVGAIAPIARAAEGVAAAPGAVYDWGRHLHIPGTTDPPMPEGGALTRSARSNPISQPFGSIAEGMEQVGQEAGLEPGLPKELAQGAGAVLPLLLLKNPELIGAFSAAEKFGQGASPGESLKTGVQQALAMHMMGKGAGALDAAITARGISPTLQRFTGRVAVNLAAPEIARVLTGDDPKEITPGSAVFALLFAVAHRGQLADREVAEKIIERVVTESVSVEDLAAAEGFVHKYQKQIGGRQDGEQKLLGPGEPPEDPIQPISDLQQQAPIQPSEQPAAAAAPDTPDGTPELLQAYRGAVAAELDKARERLASDLSRGPWMLNTNGSPYGSPEELYAAVRKAETGDEFWQIMKESPDLNLADRHHLHDWWLVGKADAAAPTQAEPGQTGPVTVRAFHGTRNQFEGAPDVNHSEAWGEGVYLGTKSEGIDDFSHEGRVIEADVTLNNPYRGEHISQETLEKLKAFDPLRSRWAYADDAFDEEPAFRNAALKELGYDGVIVEHPQYGQEVVAFDRSQVSPIKEKPDGSRVSVPPEQAEAEAASRPAAATTTAPVEGTEAVTPATPHPEADTQGEGLRPRPHVSQESSRGARPNVNLLAGDPRHQATEQLIAESWRRLRSGRRLIGEAEPGTVENAIQTQADRGWIRNEGHVRQVVAKFKGGATAEPSTRTLVHERFGEVRESSDQSGVPPGRLRVIDRDGVKHVIQNPRTAGNRAATFIRQAEGGEAPAVEGPSTPAMAEGEIVHRMHPREPRLGGQRHDVLQFGRVEPGGQVRMLGGGGISRVERGGKRLWWKAGEEGAPEVPEVALAKIRGDVGNLRKQGRAAAANRLEAAVEHYRDQVRAGKAKPLEMTSDERDHVRQVFGHLQAAGLSVEDYFDSENVYGLPVTEALTTAQIEFLKELGRQDQGPRGAAEEQVPYGEGQTERTDQTDQTETREFRRWFGDSRVVDKSGKPLVVYHGTIASKEIEDFQPYRGRRDTYRFQVREGKRPMATFFSTDPEIAGTYSAPVIAGTYKAGTYGGAVYPVYLSIQHPLVVNAKGETFFEAHTKGARDWHLGGDPISRLFERAVAKGNDGIIIKNVLDSATREHADRLSTVYISFDPKQIKSATGNRGTFDPDSAFISEMRTESGGVAATMDPRLTQVLARGLYRGNIPNVGVKEGVQNAVDAIRDNQKEGTIHVKVDTGTRRISITDTGIGMSPDTVAKEFVDPGASLKRSLQAVGGYGIAKVAMLGNADELFVSTIWRDPETGKYHKTTLEGGSRVDENGDRIPASLEWADIEGTGLQQATYEQDKLGEGETTGTTVAFMIRQGTREEYGTLEMNERVMRNYLKSMIERSNFTDVTVTGTVDGEPVLGEQKPPPEEIARLPISGGTVTLSLPHDSKTAEQPHVGVHVLSHGFYQFEDSVYLANTAKIPTLVVVNVESSTRPGDSTYPFTPNRQNLSEHVEATIQDYLNHGLVRAAIAKKLKSYQDAFQQAVPIEGSPEFSPPPETEHRTLNELSDERDRLYTALPKYEDRSPEADAVRQHYYEHEDKWRVLNERLRYVPDTNFFESVNPHSVVDTGQLGEEAVRFIASRPYMAGLSEAFEASFKVFADLLRVPDTGYRGLSTYRKHLGVNVPVRMLDPKTSYDGSLVLLNPYAISEQVDVDVSAGLGTDTPEARMEMFGQQAVATLVHEVVHQRRREHDETYAGVLTRAFAHVAPILQAEIKRINEAMRGVEWAELADDQSQVDTYARRVEHEENIFKPIISGQELSEVPGSDGVVERDSRSGQSAGPRPKRAGKRGAGDAEGKRGRPPQAREELEPYGDEEPTHDDWLPEQGRLERELVQAQTAHEQAHDDWMETARARGINSPETTAAWNRYEEALIKSQDLGRRLYVEREYAQARADLLQSYTALARPGQVFEELEDARAANQADIDRLNRLADRAMELAEPENESPQDRRERRTAEFRAAADANEAADQGWADAYDSRGENAPETAEAWVRHMEALHRLNALMDRDRAAQEEAARAERERPQELEAQEEEGPDRDRLEEERVQARAAVLQAYRDHTAAIRDSGGAHTDEAEAAEGKYDEQIRKLHSVVERIRKIEEPEDESNAARRTRLDRELGQALEAQSEARHRWNRAADRFGAEAEAETAEARIDYEEKLGRFLQLTYAVRDLPPAQDRQQLERDLQEARAASDAAYNNRAEVIENVGFDSREFDEANERLKDARELVRDLEGQLDQLNAANAPEEADPVQRQQLEREQREANDAEFLAHQAYLDLTDRVGMDSPQAIEAYDRWLETHQTSAMAAAALERFDDPDETTAAALERTLRFAQSARDTADHHRTRARERSGIDSDEYNQAHNHWAQAARNAESLQAQLDQLNATNAPEPTAPGALQRRNAPTARTQQQQELEGELAQALAASDAAEVDRIRAANRQGLNSPEYNEAVSRYEEAQARIERVKYDLDALTNPKPHGPPAPPKAPTFYSHLEKSMEKIGKKQQKFRPEQLWKEKPGEKAGTKIYSGMLSTEGVTAEEMEYTGVADLLAEAEKEGRSVTLKEVMDKAQANRMHAAANTRQVGGLQGNESEGPEEPDEEDVQELATRLYDEAREEAERDYIENSDDRPSVESEELDIDDLIEYANNQGDEEMAEALEAYHYEWRTANHERSVALTDYQNAVSGYGYDSPRVRPLQEVYERAKERVHEMSIPEQYRRWKLSVQTGSEYVRSRDDTDVIFESEREANQEAESLAQDLTERWYDDLGDMEHGLEWSEFEEQAREQLGGQPAHGGWGNQRVDPDIQGLFPGASTRKNYRLPGGDQNFEMVMNSDQADKYGTGDDDVHFGDQTKQIAWIYGDHRTTTDGREVLFIDELQSARFQEATEQHRVTKQRKGFKPSPKEAAALRERYQEVHQKAIDLYTPLVRQWINSSDGDIEDRTEELKNEPVETQEAVAAWQAAQAEKLLIGGQISHGERGVPRAPYFKTYVKLLLRQAVRQAVEAGLDHIAWNVGSTLADRYPAFSLIVDRMTYDPETKHLKVYDNGREQIDRVVEPDQLHTIIGHAPAARMLATELKDDPQHQPVWDVYLSSGELYNTGPWTEYDARIRARELNGTARLREGTSAPRVHELIGEDMDVGGKRTEEHYDKDMVKAANELLKPFKGKVEVAGAKVETGREGRYSSRYSANQDSEFNNRVYDSLRRRHMATVYDSPEALNRAVAELNKAYKTPQVHIMAIPPEMARTALQEGFRISEDEVPYDKRPNANPKDGKTAARILSAADKVARAASKLAKRMGSETGLLGLGIVDELRNTARVDLTGQDAGSHEQVAVLYQIHRDGRVETFRIIYTKGGKIVAEGAVTSRLPGATASFVTSKEALRLYKRLSAIHGPVVNDWPSRDRFNYHRVQRAAVRRGAHEMRGRMERLGADGYYLLHNHPSGAPKPSGGDISITRQIEIEVPGFMGHVVIDSGTYGLIEPSDPAILERSRASRNRWKGDAGIEDLLDNEEVRVLNLPGDFEEKLLVPSHDHPLIGAVLGEPSDVVQVANEIKSRHYVAFFLDATTKVRAIETVPKALILNSAEFKNWVRGRQRDYGASRLILAGPPDPTHSNANAWTMSNEARKYVQDGTILDYVVAGEAGTMRSKGISSRYGRYGPETFIGGTRAHEEEAPYGAHPPDSKEANDAYLEAVIGGLEKTRSTRSQAKRDPSASGILQSNLDSHRLRAIEAGLTGSDLIEHVRAALINDINEDPRLKEASPGRKLAAFRKMQTETVDRWIRRLEHQEEPASVRAGAQVAAVKRVIEIHRRLITDKLPEELQKKVLRMADDIGKHQTGKKPRWRTTADTVDYVKAKFMSRIAVMTRQFGTGGAELTNRLSEGDLKRRDLMDAANSYLDRISRSTEGLNAFASVDLSNEVIKALENRGDSAAILSTDPAREVYQAAVDMLDFFREEMKRVGYKTRDNYFSHVGDVDILDQVLGGVEDPRSVDKGKLNKYIDYKSNFFKPRRASNLKHNQDVVAVLRAYSKSASKALAYREAVEYYYSRFLQDIPTRLRNQNMDRAMNMMRGALGPEKGHGFMYRMLHAARSNMYRNFLTFNLKAAAQNRTQVEFGRMRWVPEADRLWKKTRSKRDATGALADAIELASQETERYAKMLKYSDEDPREGRIDRFLTRFDPFQQSEGKNWGDVEYGSLLNNVMKRPEYKAAVKANGGDKFKAINEVLDNPKFFAEAVREAGVTAAETQVASNPAMRSEVYDSPLARTFLMFTAFKSRQLQVLGQLLGKQAGVRGARAQAILKRGISGQVHPVEVLREVELNRRLLEELRPKAKKAKVDIGMTDKQLRDYIDHLKTQEKDLNGIIKELEPLGGNTPRRLAIMARYGAKQMMISFGFRMFWAMVAAGAAGALGGDDKKKKKPESLTEEGLKKLGAKDALEKIPGVSDEISDTIIKAASDSFYDAMPFSVYGQMPPILGLVLESPKDAFPYGRFSPRAAAKSVAKQAIPVLPFAGLVNRASSYKPADWLVDQVAPPAQKPAPAIPRSPRPPAVHRIR